MSSKQPLSKKVAKEDVDMAKVSNLRLRGRKYWYYRYIPNDVREFFDGKEQVWINLQTSDFTEAKAKCLQLTLEHDQRIAEFRQGQAAVASFFTDGYISSLAEAWAVDWLRQDEQHRISAGAADPHLVSLLGITHTPQSLRSLLMLETKEGWDGLSPFIASDWLARQSVVMPRSSDAFKTLCYRIRQAALQALETIRLRTEGVPVASPAPVKVTTPKAKQGIADLIEPWKVRQKPKDASIREFDRAVARFNEKHPDLAVCDIESVHIVEYRDWLTGQSLAAATVEKHMNAIKALLGIAVERNVIKHNPASKIKPPKASKDDGDAREPFGLSDLKLIFSSPIYRGGEVSEGGKGEAAFWLPLMGLFSGAREEELCQLRLDDFREEEGVHYYLIRRKHKEQDTKTDSSVRRVPIHRELIRQGLLRYIQTLRIRGEEWLFPLLVPDVKGNRSGNWSKWFHRYLRQTIKITDPALVFHSFRHTFKDGCRECLIPEDVHDALTGHTNANVSRSYGSGLYPLLPLVDAMDRFSVRGLDLSEVVSPYTE